MRCIARLHKGLGAINTGYRERQAGSAEENAFSSLPFFPSSSTLTLSGECAAGLSCAMPLRSALPASVSPPAPSTAHAPLRRGAADAMGQRRFEIWRLSSALLCCCLASLRRAAPVPAVVGWGAPQAAGVCAVPRCCCCCRRWAATAMACAAEGRASQGQSEAEEDIPGTRTSAPLPSARGAMEGARGQGQAQHARTVRTPSRCAGERRCSVRGRRRV